MKKTSESKAQGPVGQATKKLIIDLLVDSTNILVQAIPSAIFSESKKSEFLTSLTEKANSEPGVHDIEELKASLETISSSTSKPLSEIIGNLIAFADRELEIALPGMGSTMTISVLQTTLIPLIALGLSQIPGIEKSKEEISSNIQESIFHYKSKYDGIKGDKAQEDVAKAYAESFLDENLPESATALLPELIGDLVSLAGNEAADNIPS